MREEFLKDFLLRISCSGSVEIWLGVLPFGEFGLQVDGSSRQHHLIVKFVAKLIF